MTHLSLTRAASACAGLLLAGLATAQTSAPAVFPAVLEGHAVLPAATFIAPPKDAPANLSLSGRFMHSDMRRRDEPGSIRGVAFLSDPKAPRPTGMDAPFKGQPVPGFSGIKAAKDGTLWVPSDNGFGSRANSPDAMLMFHQMRADWKTGEFKRLRTIFLHDPDGRVPFNIVNSATAKRYLTGADFDIESIQVIGDTIWLGDEFGPYLIRADRNGKVTGVFETRVDGALLRSPDHFSVVAPATPGNFVTPVRRSRGFEGMAASPDGRFLYPMLEGPLWNAEARAWETHEGKEAVRILEFDTEKGVYTGRVMRYALEQAGNNIGDFNFIDATTALVIERDNGEGDPAQACNGPAREDCFNVPARFKRIYKIDTANLDAGGFVRKIGYIDLLDIQDPRGVARIGGTKTAAGSKFTFPHWCIEGLDIIDAEHIAVLNDNNLGVAQAREFGRNEANEVILLRVPELLRAR
jgi:hypothetical protein